MQDRFQQLQANMRKAGASNVIAAHADFLSLDLSEARFAEVRGALIDPSCSGSGTAHSRMDHLLPSAQLAPSSRDSERLDKLVRFQIRILSHALQLPKLQRLVYSTCSVHEEENEGVVRAVLPQAQQLGFRLKDPFPSWTRRGLPVVEDAHCLIRTDPAFDQTDGFFLALFVRETTL